MQKNERQKYSMFRNTIFNAGANLMKSKNAKEIPLFNELEKDSIKENPEKNQSERDMLFSRKSG